jgi:hypothetical protein
VSEICGPCLEWPSSYDKPISGGMAPYPSNTTDISLPFYGLDPAEPVRFRD